MFTLLSQGPPRSTNALKYHEYNIPKKLEDRPHIQGDGFDYLKNGSDKSIIQRHKLGFMVTCIQLSLSTILRFTEILKHCIGESNHRQNSIVNVPSTPVVSDDIPGPITNHNSAQSAQ
ncbi:hypothetical protein V3C99_006118 [Haemonchus contortus]